MTPKSTTLTRITTFIETTQNTALDAISTERVVKSEHIRRAIDMYLSQPAIQEALVELKKEPEALSDQQRGV